PPVLEVPSELPGRGCFPRPLEAAENDDGGRHVGVLEFLSLSGQQLFQLLSHDADELLSWGEALQDLPPHGASPHSLEKITDHLDIDIRLQERQSHLPQPLLDHGLGEVALTPEPAEDPLEPIAELLEHAPPGGTECETRYFRDLARGVST